MVEINVVKAFTFQHDPVKTGTRRDEKTGEELPVFAAVGEMQPFAVGRHEVSEAVAEHWYVKAHLEGYVNPPPQVGQPDFLQQQLLASQAARDGVSMEEAAPKPAPPLIEVMQSGSNIPQDSVYFAGKKQPEQPTPATGMSWLPGSAS